MRLRGPGHRRVGRGKLVGGLSPPIDARDLEGILSDPRLTGLTDPAVNEAGKDVDVEQLTG